jgi:uncharacterized protein
MRTRVYAGLMTIAFGVLPAMGLADDASHRRAAEALLITIKAAQEIQKSADRLREQLLQQHPQLAPHQAAVQTFITTHMNWPSLKEDLITLYVQAFTEDELQQLTTFYRTPVGQKAADTMPALAHAGTQLGITRLQAHREELQRMLEADPGQSKGQ